MNLRLPVTVFAVSLILITSVPAGFTELDRPQLHFEAEYPEAARKGVREVLQRMDCEFLGGAKLNGMTSLRYRLGVVGFVGGVWGQRCHVDRRFR